MGLLKRKACGLGRKQTSQPRNTDDISLAGILEGKPNKLFFLPSGHGHLTSDKHEISERVLFQSLLKQNRETLIQSDHESKIGFQVETHRQRGKPVKTRPLHIFLVIKAVSHKNGEFWWSLEKTVKHAVAQRRSRDKDSDNTKWKESEQDIADELEGKGYFGELLTLQRIRMIIVVQYQSYLTRCKSLVLLITKNEKEIRDHEIPEHVLFQSLLEQNVESFIQSDHESKIVQVETHRQKGRSIKTGPFHIFIIFKTVSEKDGEFWWSLGETEKNEVVLQRSRDKDEVKNKFRETELIAEELEGKGCMRELLTLLWIHMIVDVKCQRYLSRCQSLIPLVMRKITKMRYEYKSDFFSYSALSAEENKPDLSDVIDFLSNVSNWHPLVVATYLGDTELLDRLKKDGKYNINGIYNSFTLLNLAILFSKTEMVQHLLGQMKADPTRCDKKGRNALHLAAKFNREKKIIDLLLSKVPIDQCDATGTTALHHAIMASNTEIVQFLLDNGADPKKMDRTGHSPLHVAAFYATDTKIIDLLHQKKEIANSNEGKKTGVTALHVAAMASNITTARQLLKKGAEINCRDKSGLTPLHVAAFFAKDMEFINLFLNSETVNLHCCDELGQNVIAYAQKNTYGLRQQIIDRVKEIDGEVIKEYNLLKLAKSEMHIPFWKSLIWDILISKTDAWLSTPSIQTAHSSMSKGNRYKLKLFYVPYADLNPGKGIEISEFALIRYMDKKGGIPKQPDFTESEMRGTAELLSDINHHSTIEEVQIYQSSSNCMANLSKAFHSFIIFRTASDKDGVHWWSLDKNLEYIVLQRSRDKDAVENKFGGKERKDTKFTVKSLVGKVSISNHFNGNPAVLDFKSMLVGLPISHPLFLLVYFGNVNLFDRIKKMAKSKHLKDCFENKLNSLLNTTERNKSETATNKNEAKINECDELGRSALHLAAGTSNVDVAKRLIKMGANPNLLDKNGLSPLHLAAYHCHSTEMIDLLLEAQKQSQGDEGIDNFDNVTSDGITALHCAAIASNDITAKHLIKRRADPKRKDKLGRTPLHYAAFFAKNIDIVNVLLNNKQVDVDSLDNCKRDTFYYAKFNQHGLTEKIVNRFKFRFKEKGVKSTTPQFKSELKSGHIFSDLRVWMPFLFLIIVIVYCLSTSFPFFEIFQTSIDQMRNFVPSSMSSHFIIPRIIPLTNIVQQIL